MLLSRLLRPSRLHPRSLRRRIPLQEQSGAASAPVAAVAPIHGILAYPRVAPIAPVAMAPPPAWPGQSNHSRSSSGNGYSYAYRADDEQRFVIVTGKSDSLTMSGSTEDARSCREISRRRFRVTSSGSNATRSRTSFAIRPRSIAPQIVGSARGTGQKTGRTRQAAGGSGTATGSARRQDGTGSRECS